MVRLKWINDSGIDWLLKLEDNEKKLLLSFEDYPDYKMSDDICCFPFRTTHLFFNNYTTK